MIKEFNEELASMRSLMERMGRHMTGSQAEYITENCLEEAIASNSGKLEPNVLMTIDEDNSNKTRMLKVFIGPLFPNDVKKLEGMFDCSQLNYKGMNGVIFNKSLPFKKNARGKKNAADNGQADPQASDPQVSAPQAQPKKGLGLLGRLQAGGNKGGNLTEGLLGRLQAGANAAQPTPQATAPQTQAAPQVAAPQQANPNGNAPDDIVNWLNKVVIPAIKSISGNQNYEQGHIANLMDVNYLIDKYLVAPEKTDSNYSEESTEEIKKEVAEAIKNGNWDAIASVFSPINLQAVIFGNVLSGRNQRMIQRQASDYGINPGDPDYPTNLYAPNKWVTKFGRRVLPNAKYKWYTMAPRMNDRGTKVNLGSKGHYDEFGQDLKGFQPAWLYDISDTERIPASEYDKYGLNPDKMDPNVDYHKDIPGLANNLTGELNPHAEAAKNAALQAQQASLTAEQTALLQEIQSDEGKAKVYNDALLKYAEKNNFSGSINLIDVRNSSNVLVDYASNIVNVCDYILKKMRYSNQSLIEPLKIISAFAVGCKTTGAKEVLTLFGRRTSDTKQLLSDWDNACQVTLQSVTMIINFMIKYLMDKYAKFEDVSAAPQTQAVSDTDSGSVQLTESIESLLDELMK